MYILSFLSVPELSSVQRVSRYWRRLAEVRPSLNPFTTTFIPRPCIPSRTTPHAIMWSLYARALRYRGCV
jgi:hypothetical protein